LVIGYWLFVVCCLLLAHLLTKYFCVGWVEQRETQHQTDVQLNQILS